MNVLFIFSLNDIQSANKPLSTPEQAQLGISYISSLLKTRGHDTRLLILSSTLQSKNYRIINDYLKEFYPKIICFTAVSSEYPFIEKMARFIRSHFPEIYLVVGGPHVSMNPEGILGVFDALCIGEGEFPTVELVAQLEKGQHPLEIKNIWVKKGGEIEKNEPRPFLENLDILPFPDREMWQEWIDDKAEPGARYSVLLGRGCPFECTYCCNHTLKRVAPGQYVRFRSPDNIIREIKEISERYPTKKEIYLEIETIGINANWAIDLCSKLEEFNSTLNKPISFGTNLRITPNADLEDLFIAFKKSNFRFINIGLESGSERIRREVLKRNYSNEDVVRTVKLARNHGCKVSLFNMIGIPGETIEDFKETVRINQVCMADWHLTSIFYPYPGTELYFSSKRQGLLKENSHTLMERWEATLDLPGFSKKQIQKSYIWFDYYAFKGIKPIHKILARVLMSKFRSKYYTAFIYNKLVQFSLFRWMRKNLSDRLNS